MLCSVVWSECSYGGCAHVRLFSECKWLVYGQHCHLAGDGIVRCLLHLLVAEQSAASGGNAAAANEALFGRAAMGKSIPQPI